MPTRALGRTFAVLAASICIVVVEPTIHAQQPAPAASAVKLPAFDVISVKLNNSASHQSTLQFTPDGIHVTNLGVEFILRGAFGVNDDQLINLPGWAKSIAYDIEAKVAPEDVPALKNLNREQHFTMVLNILTDRFKLTYHHETRTLPEYALVIARSGPKLQEFKPTIGDNGKSRENLMMSRSSLTGNAIDIAMLARGLSDRIGRPIVDKTGLTGKYSFKLDWANEPHEGGGPGGPAHDAGFSGAPAAGDTGPSIFTAVEEQLGLKLNAEKGPVDVVVIDHLEQPAAD